MVDTTDLPLEGSCLCGAVQVCATHPPILTLACHCSDCQKLTASAYSLTAIIPSEGFSVLKGQLVLGGRKNNQRRHYFCSECMTFVYTQIDGKNDRVNVRTSIFDNTSILVPFIELMTKEKLPWVSVPVSHSFTSSPQTSHEFDALTSEYAQWFQSQRKK